MWGCVIFGTFQSAYADMFRASRNLSRGFLAIRIFYCARSKNLWFVIPLSIFLKKYFRRGHWNVLFWKEAFNYPFLAKKHFLRGKLRQKGPPEEPERKNGLQWPPFKIGFSKLGEITLYIIQLSPSKVDIR